MGSTVEVFTVGGGEYLVNVFNAIAAWSGAGGYRALLRVVMVMGFAMALMTTAWNMDPRALIRWFMQATLMYMVLMVPTTGQGHRPHQSGTCAGGRRQRADRACRHCELHEPDRRLPHDLGRDRLRHAGFAQLFDGRHDLRRRSCSMRRRTCGSTIRRWRSISTSISSNACSMTC
jgi:hypothetical protein